MNSGESLLWAIFAITILILFALDMGVFHRQSHKISIREALIWTGIWMAVAFLFNLAGLLLDGAGGGY